MRTTLTIEEPIARRLQERVDKSQRTLKDVVNEALREGLNVIEKGEATKPRKFRSRTHDFQFRPGIDLDRIGRFAEELDDEELIRKALE